MSLIQEYAKEQARSYGECLSQFADFYDSLVFGSYMRMDAWSHSQERLKAAWEAKMKLLMEK